MSLAGVQWTTLDSFQPSFTLLHNPSIQILNHHNKVFDIRHLNSTQERRQWFSRTTTTRCYLQLVQRAATPITQRDTR